MITLRNFKSIRASYKDCSFRVILPKISIVKQYVNISFLVNCEQNTPPVKYLVKEWSVTDKLGNKAISEVNNQCNFDSHSKHSLGLENNRLLMSSLTITLDFLTNEGNYVEVTYLYERNKPVLLKSVAIADMTDEEKDLFNKVFEGYIPPPPPPKPMPTSPIPTVFASPPLGLNPYIDALTNELFYLKHHGGKKHTVTDGRLLTPDSKEYCYSFELESELYLSDDAPVSVIFGLNTVNGTVIVCDGFQIIVSLERDIGEKVPSAQISVEPWKLLEKLRDRIKLITANDKIAWKIFHEGPKLAETISNISSVKCGQGEAIGHAIEEPITMVWGPPGTGKTYTMAKMTEQFVSMGKSVLIVSHSNISVDNVVKQISKQFSSNHLAPILKEGKVLRYGYVRDEELSENENCVAFNFTLNCYPDLKKQYYTLSEESKKLRIELQFKYDIEKAQRRKELEKILKGIRARLKESSQKFALNAQVVATTVSKIYMDTLFDNKSYDVVMFDEVSMAYVPQILCAATFAREKFVCVGDFRQLAPIVQSDGAKDALQDDIFTFLNICKHGEIHNHPWLVMLNEQRRMHPDISRFANRYIYNGLLKDHTSMASKWDDIVACNPLSEEAIALLDLAGTFCAASKNVDNSRFNIFSAIISFAIALNSEKAQNDFLDFKSEEKVGIITPYAAQTRLIRAIVQDYRQKDSTAISCATVHQFQGSERNVVVFDAVESYPFVRPGWLVSKNENASVLRLVNVALTRARCKFITLANTRFWNNKFRETQNTYFRLLAHIHNNNKTVTMSEDALINLFKNLDFGKNIKAYFATEDALELLLKDIKSAKKKIIITMPTDKLNPAYEGVLYDAIKEQSHIGIEIASKAKDVERFNDAWKNIAFKSKDAAFPLIVIDDRITWYGFPLSELFFEDKNYRYLAPKSPIFRITGKHTNEMIYSLCDLDCRIDDTSGTRVKLADKKPSIITGYNGLSDYVRNNEKCKKCGTAMNMLRGRSGKFCMKCSSCDTFDLLPVDTVNAYLDKTDARCSVCGRDLYARVGPYGIYVKCSDGHYTKLSEV